MTTVQPYDSAVLRLLFVVSGGVFSLYVAWIGLYLFDFIYPVFYDWLNIDKHIQQYGPDNNFKPYLHLADKTEHVRLFSAINYAVHHHGEGLTAIEYFGQDKQAFGLMLRMPEIIHLNDVANLLNNLHPYVAFTSLIWLALAVAAFYGRLKPPNFKQQVMALLAFLIGLSFILLLVGPQYVFEQFHHFVFPDDHPWFFYYEDSLMSTLMKAPDLFFAIALLWLALSVIIYLLVNKLLPK